VQILFALHSIFFAPGKKSDDPEETDTYTESKGKEPMVDEQQWEMVRIPETPGAGRDFPLSPTTPRTRAFNTLGGGRPAGNQHFPPPPTKAKKGWFAKK
jgi:hypothetical protein